MIDGGLSNVFREHLPRFHFQRIETGGTGRGIPDTNYAAPDGGGIEGWLEYKTTDGWILGLGRRIKPEQLGWMSRRARMGCRVWCAIRRRHGGGPRRGPAVDELWLVPGCSVMQVNAHGLRPLAEDGAARVAAGVLWWTGGPRAWDWAAVHAALVR